ncbi:MAG: carboxy-S-adenosyl-L-methionine synthase CmoA [Pseudomonadota bacterium]
MTSSKDTLFQHEALAHQAFRFDDAVANVFPDMINRSVPGYADSLEGIRGFAAELVPDGGRCYDLGCSLGAATLAMCLGLDKRPATMIAIDNSAAMIDRCKRDLAFDGRAQDINFREQDITQCAIEQADLVVMNYTLQFVAPEARPDLLRRIRSGLKPGGAVIISEKFRFDDAAVQSLMTRRHHAFKRRHDYSDLEIAGKRAALENVLIADTRQTHIARLNDAGFIGATLWLANLNFGSLIAFRP